MAITTEEFEQRLKDLLTKMECWPRCKWCGCNDRQRRTADKSKLCNACKEWDRRERRAEEWIQQHPESQSTEQYMRVEYNVEYAALCREEGQICSWKGPITPLNLEWELKSISERFCGEDVFGHTTLYFEQFSETQRRLLMFLFEELTKVWVRHRRQSFAIERVMQKRFPTK
jgi:hypothetical protein